MKINLRPGLFLIPVTALWWSFASSAEPVDPIQSIMSRAAFECAHVGATYVGVAMDQANGIEIERIMLKLGRQFDDDLKKGMIYTDGLDRNQWAQEVFTMSHQALQYLRLKDPMLSGPGLLAMRGDLITQYVEDCMTKARDAL